MADLNLTKSVSVTSFTSDMLDDEEEVVVDNHHHAVAPYDIMGHHPEVGVIIVAKEGAKLPYKSNYYKNKDNTLAVKFEVSNSLEVTVAGEREIKKKVQVRNVSVHQEADVPDPIIPTASSSFSQELSPSDIDLSETSAPRVSGDSGGSERQVQGGKKFRSLGEFLSNVDKNFEAIVIGGLEAGMRKSVGEKMKNKQELLAKENMGIVHALNQVVFDEYGAERPDPKVCQKLGEILKDKFPQTFRIDRAVQTSFGALKMKKSKGEGGNSELSKRIGDNFYNKHTKKLVKMSTAAGDSSQDSPAGPSAKKVKKSYGIVPDRYNHGLNASKAEMEHAKNMFKKISEVESLEEKKHLVIASRVFIQSQFRSVQPSQTVEDLEQFWSAGPRILSDWFEWIVRGSKDGSLNLSVDLQMTKVMNLVEQYILAKKGADFEKEIRGVKEITDLHHENDSWFKIFLLKDLAKLFKNRSEKLIFVDGSDDVKNGPNEQQPNVFVTKQNVIGQEEYDEKIVISLRVGNKVLFQDVSLSEALAGCIQLYFCFHQYYPEEADDLYQFVQRICCNFGDQDGANNKKGVIKKCFRDFEVNDVLL